MTSAKFARVARAAAALALSAFAFGAAHAAVTITVINGNEPGVGFNDPTPASPVGGNSGTTLGQQRLIAFQHAADIWGATLTSAVPVRVEAVFEPLPCSAGSAVLGAAGAYEVFDQFENNPHPNSWYPSALAAKLAGREVTDNPHITASFNSRLGLFSDCLPGSAFYLGLDNKAPSGQIDFVTVLLHELGHGLGFQTWTDDATGAEFFGEPSVWDYFLVDNRTNKAWVQMTDAERAASAISGNGLSWNGPFVTAAVPGVLGAASNLAIGGVAAGGAAGNYSVGDASFGPALGTPAVTGQLMRVVDQANGTGLACGPLSPLNARAVKGNVALVDRGTCAFTVKARAVQAAGAIGMVVADNQPGDVAGMGGDDPLVKIPSVRITQADGNTLKTLLQRRSRTRSGVIASLGLDPSRLAGADAAHRIMMYTPPVNEPGSSVSHYTTAARSNQLMEPFINPDLAHEVAPSYDLTFPLLRDIGW